MNKILCVSLLALIGCDASTNIPPAITAMRDDAHAVPCRLSIYNGASSITCLPNWIVEEPRDSESEPENSARLDPSSTGTLILNAEMFGL